ncbi:MAG: TonB-dependent receptor [Pyrinomonadaceae bacterium]|nr:TonB-dependent receptor [Pyrinomonadaceae bacterium]
MHNLAPNSSIPGGMYRWLNVLLVLAALTAPALAQNPSKDLTNSSLEDLLNLEVTSVSKKEEKLFQTAAAVYVITQEEIRRSGLTSIPELLRLAPGLQVARIDGTKWAISARGFNGRIANKLLVLIDGRSVYSPETSGVYWEVQDLLLENIERIEVIRGPGGTLWGANAVNGVINIITKSTQETREGVVTASAGSEEQGFGSFRYGANLGDKASYRVFGKYLNRRELVDATGLRANDGMQFGRGGGRVEWQPTERDNLTLDGDIYRTNLRENPTAVSPADPFAPFGNKSGELTGGHILGRWERAYSKRSDIALQVYYDRFSRKLFELADDINTFDLDFQHHTALGSRQDIVWGFGYRLVSHQTEDNSSRPIRFTPSAKKVQLFSGFAQDEVNLVKDRLRLILGVKLEHNYLTGFEAQPSVRLSWTPSASQTAWAAVSRAVRTPARSQQDIRVNYQAFPGPGGIPVLVSVFGSPGPKSETLQAYELGYRAQPHRRLSLDVATFYNAYDRLTSFEPGLPFFETDPQPALVVPTYYGNLLYGETYGLEAAVNLEVTRRWKLRGSYSFLRLQLHRDAASTDTISEGAEGYDPRHQFQLHSYLNLWRSFDLDTALYRVSRLSGQQVPGYTRIDSRLGWHARENVEISGGVQNLLDNRHAEFNGPDTLVVASQVRRSVYGKVTFRF